MHPRPQKAEAVGAPAAPGNKHLNASPHVACLSLTETEDVGLGDRDGHNSNAKL